MNKVLFSILFFMPSIITIKPEINRYVGIFKNDWSQFVYESFEIESEEILHCMSFCKIAQGCQFFLLIGQICYLGNREMGNLSHIEENLSTQKIFEIIEQDIDECSQSNGGCTQTCINTFGSFSCSCSTGYSLNTDGITCDDVDECLTGNGGCGQTCTNNIGSFTCSCGTGFILNMDGLNCDDIDECSSGNGGCSQTCINNIGSFDCSCDNGYSLNVDGLSCDVNFCPHSMPYAIGNALQCCQHKLRSNSVGCLGPVNTPIEVTDSIECCSNSDIQTCTNGAVPVATCRDAQFCPHYMPYAIVNGASCCAHKYRSATCPQGISGSNIEIGDSVECCLDGEFQECLTDDNVSALCSVINRHDCCRYRMQGLSGHVGYLHEVPGQLSVNPLCASIGPDFINLILILECATPLSGTYVTISLDTTQYLQLEEVLIGKPLPKSTCRPGYHLNEDGFSCDGNFCPHSKPYAVGNSSYCCTHNLRSNSPLCEGTVGTPIEATDNEACCQNDEYQPCLDGTIPGATCRDAVFCPATNPFPVDGGYFCCAQNTRGTNCPQGVTGTALQSDDYLSCCLNNNFWKCTSNDGVRAPCIDL